MAYVRPCVSFSLIIPLNLISSVLCGSPNTHSGSQFVRLSRCFLLRQLPLISVCRLVSHRLYNYANPPLHVAGEGPSLRRLLCSYRTSHLPIQSRSRHLIVAVVAMKSFSAEMPADGRQPLEFSDTLCSVSPSTLGLPLVSGDVLLLLLPLCFNLFARFCLQARRQR